MYECYFEFHARPFAAAPVADLYFPASSIESAYHTSVRCISRGEGPVLVLGGAGIGKSMLCHLISRRFESEFAIALLNGVGLKSVRELLQSILYELDLPYQGLEEGEARLMLIDFLKPRNREPTEGAGLLLLLDEAHGLSAELLEEVRLLTNIVADGEPRARIVLAGTPSIEELLAEPKLESLNQRIAARCYLHPLTYDETLDYVTAQISAAGGDPVTLFTEEALQAVYRSSDGIPRLINQVCDHALILACDAKRKSIDGALIEQAWADLQQLPPPSPPVTGESSSAAEVIEFGALETEENMALESSEAEEDFDAVTPSHNEIDLTEQLDRIQVRGATLEQQDSNELSDELAERSSLASREVEDESYENRTLNPFDECFEEEVAVEDRYAALDARSAESGCEALNAPDSVESGEAIVGDAPSDLPMPAPTVPAVSPADAACTIGEDGNPEPQTEGPSPSVQVVRKPPDDSDLIVLVGEEPREGRLGGPAGRAHRQEYSQLFARLRRTHSPGDP